MADDSITDDRTTKDKATDVATTAKEEARGVAGDARSEAAAVVSEAGAQAQHLVDEARTTLRQQASDGANRAAGAVDELGTRFRALADGDAEQAGDLQRYARDLGDRLGDVAGRMNARGFDGLVDDLQRFARRRPGVFLAVTAGAGFAAGRLFRGAKADAESPSTSSNGNASGQAGSAGGIAGSGRASAGEPVTALPPQGPDPALDELSRAAQPSGLRDEPQTGAVPAGPEAGMTPTTDLHRGATSQSTPAEPR